MKKRVFSTLLLLICVVFFSAAKDFVVVIDPGHGGKDPGAIGKTGREKDINLNVAQKVGDMIEKNHSNVKVIYTRTTDKYVTLQERPNIANRSNGDLYISIHTNASESTSAYGAETFTLGLSKSKANFEVAKRENSVLLLEDNNKETYQGFDPTSPDSYIMFEFMQSKYIDQSVEIASYIQNEFTNIKRLDRGVRQDIFWVLHQVKMPSILIELGFITNTNEEKYLLSSQGQAELAESIYNGFNKYKHEYDKRTVASLQTEVAKEQPKDTNITKDVPVAEVDTKKPADNSDKQKKEEETKSEKENNKEIATTPKEEKPINKPTTPTKKDQSNIPSTTKTNNGIVYKLQVFSSKTEVPKDNRDYRRLRDTKLTFGYFIENGWYKYTCGESNSYDEIVKTREELKSYFPDAFILAFKNGKRISIQEARNQK